MKPYPDRKDGKRVWLSQDEIETVIDEAENTEQEIAFKLGAQCGLRRKEIARVRVKDLVTDEKGHYHLRVWEDYAKHNHYREPPVPDSVANKVEAMADFGDLDDNDQIIDYTDKTVYRWLMRATDRLEAETGDEGWDRVDVHDLRRSWATHILGQGVLPSVVMSWGGWTDWETFRRHYLGEFSPEVLEREREKVKFYADGDPLDAQPTANTTVPTSGGHYADD